MMRIFITGATGYIGHELSMFLAKKNIKVNALVRNVKSLKIPYHENITLFQGDICDRSSIDKAMNGCDYVFHTAAFTDLRCSQIDKFYSANVGGTKIVLEAALRNNIKKVIFTSTLAVFGSAIYRVPIAEDHPRLNSIANDYELTKIMAEELVFRYSKKGLPTCILNVTRVYGPGLQNYSNGLCALIKKFQKNRFFVAPNRLEAEANYVFINDVIQAHYAAITHGKDGERYIIGGENSDYSTLFNTIKKVTSSKIKIVKVNYRLLSYLVRFYASIGNLFRFRVLVTPGVMKSLFTHRSATTKKAKNELNLQVTPLQLGLKYTINHFKRP